MVAIRNCACKTDGMAKQHQSRAHVDAQDEEAEAVLAACRVLVAISASSIAAVEEVTDLIQWRALVVISEKETVSLSELSKAMKIHLTRASRLCDRLVATGLINRADDPANRRQLILTLTPKGTELVEQVMRRRREALQPILDRMKKRMTAQRRAEVTSLLQDFAAAGAEPSELDQDAGEWTI